MLPDVKSRWKAYEYAARCLRRAFPDRAVALSAIVQTWLWQNPGEKRGRCPLCGRQFLHEVHRLVVSESASRADEAMALIQQGLLGSGSSRADTPKEDITFRLSGYGAFERMGRRDLLCEHCAIAADALLSDPPSDNGDAAWSDAVRALRAARSPGADRAERVLGGEQMNAVGWSIDHARCDFCARDRRTLHVPWLAICDDCASKAALAARTGPDRNE